MKYEQTNDDWRRAGTLPATLALSDEPESEPLLNRCSRKVEQFLGDYPGTALAVAVTLGFTFGWMVKRK